MVAPGGGEIRVSLTGWLAAAVVEIHPLHGSLLPAHVSI